MEDETISLITFEVKMAYGDQGYKMRVFSSPINQEAKAILDEVGANWVTFSFGIVELLLGASKDLLAEMIEDLARGMDEERKEE